MMEELVVLVDHADSPMGTMEKMEAHQKAMLHRAVSVFVFDLNGRMLIQRRAFDKYHSPGLWTNTACTHPRPEESILEAANRRLNEEMGLKTTTLVKLFDFVYKEALENGLTEYEFDHVYLGFCDVAPMPNPLEVSEFQYVYPDDLLKSIQFAPALYTVWFKKIVERVIQAVSMQQSMI